MKKLIYLFALILISLYACENDSSLDGTTDEAYLGESYGLLTADGMGSASNTGNTGGQAGIVSAGEWNDLNNWNFWKELLIKNDSLNYPAYWQLFTNNRITVRLKNNNAPLVDIEVSILRNDHEVWQSKTDNKGIAHLWLGAFQKENIFDLSQFTLHIGGENYDGEVQFIENGIIEINSNIQQEINNNVELAFIVDATGSMGDELHFLKEDLKNVIKRIEEEEPTLNIFTGTVFYRDQGDDYITKHSPFSQNIDNTLNFINQQSANGGGDYPEAVHSAINSALVDLQWSSNARNRIAFLLLDAPPHYQSDVIQDIQSSVKSYAQKGIKIIPITASGIEKDTEYLMRSMAILTNGTYVFITNDSGVGNEHIEASVGQYEVEKLNDLLVRLVKMYSKIES